MAGISAPAKCQSIAMRFNAKTRKQESIVEAIFCRFRVDMDGDYFSRFIAK